MKTTFLTDLFWARMLVKVDDMVWYNSIKVMWVPRASAYSCGGRFHLVLVCLSQ